MFMLGVEDKEGEGDESSQQPSSHTDREDEEENIFFCDRTKLEVTYDVFDHANSIRIWNGQGKLRVPAQEPSRDARPCRRG